jgi:hypothetical protein
MLGILACSVTPLCADGYSESDNFLLAAKDFPFPPDDSDLPENQPSEDGANKPNAGKDVLPPPDSN